jgi:23S rRNA (guanosine2251-2'-O)-methyltransferase
MESLVLIVHNVRSCHNVGSLLRTADGIGVEKIYLTGYTPYPTIEDDPRLPHIRDKLSRQINKTALGAENSVGWEHGPDILKLIENLKSKDYEIVALEQTKTAFPLNEYSVAKKVALIVGNEVSGLDDDLLKRTDKQIEIPMRGKKESFNVTVAAAIALYNLKHH